MEYRQTRVDIVKRYSGRYDSTNPGQPGCFERANWLTACLGCFKRGADSGPRVGAATAASMLALMMICVFPMARAHEAAADWRKRFDEVYRLENDEVLRRVAPPFIPERERYYIEKFSRPGRALPKPPDNITFQWDGASHLWGEERTSGSRPLGEVLVHTLGLTVSDFEGPKNLLELDIPGDWILRKSASLEDILHALEEILKEDFDRQVCFVCRQVDREVIVARGQFHFRPPTGTYDDSRVHVYGDILLDQSTGLGSGDLSRFLRTADNWLDFRIVDETRKGGNEDDQARIPWALHRDSHHAEMMDEDRMAKVNKVLANLARQTSLTFTIERRPVDVWFVVEVEEESATALRISRMATQRANELGVDVLPFPMLGLPYDFALTSVEGQVIDSKTFRGKVLLVDFWATWCWSCIKKIPRMKELHAKWHPQDLEIVSVNLDLDERTMANAVKSLSMPWPQVMAPNEPSARELWYQATGISTIPRCLIIDRQGIVRADCRPEELEQELTHLIGLETP